MKTYFSTYSPLRSKHFCQRTGNFLMSVLYKIIDRVSGQLSSNSSTRKSFPNFSPPVPRLPKQV